MNKGDKKISKFIFIIQISCLFLLGSYNSCSVYSYNDFFLDEVSRLVRGVTDVPLLTQDIIEREVAATGGWKSLGMNYKGTIETISGKNLTQPLTLVKKIGGGFHRNLIARLLDEFFLNLSPEEIARHMFHIDETNPLYQYYQDRMDEGKFDYKFQHVPYPIAEHEAGYYYIYFKGDEGIPAEFAHTHIKLGEFELFATLMYSAGLDVTLDITDVDDVNISKNIIFAGDWFREYQVLSNTWQRIDYDANSVLLRQDEELNYIIDHFLDEHGGLIEEKLGEWKYRLLKLTVKDYKGDLSLSENVQFRIFFNRYQREALSEYYPD